MVALATIKYVIFTYINRDTVDLDDVKGTFE